jgi:hypothetical protein
MQPLRCTTRRTIAIDDTRRRGEMCNWRATKASTASIPRRHRRGPHERSLASSLPSDRFEFACSRAAGSMRTLRPQRRGHVLERTGPTNTLRRSHETI